MSKVAHYEIIPIFIMFYFAMFTKSFDLSCLSLFFVAVVGLTFSVIGNYREKEGKCMVIVGRLISTLSTLVMLGISIIRTFQNGDVDGN